jgi:hypothetical protein
MREFFSGWKRKLGCAALAIALVLMTASSRSLVIEDVLTFPFWKCGYQVASTRGCVFWRCSWRSDGRDISGRFSAGWMSLELGNSRPPVSESLLEQLGFAYRSAERRSVETRELMVPYWLFAFPLGLLSAWLILGKRHPPPMISDSAMLEPKSQITDPLR